MSGHEPFCRQTQMDGTIATIHVWIGVFQSGAEKIIATDIPMPGTADETRHLTLIHTRLDAAQRMRRLAEQIRRRTQGEHDPLVKVELREYHLGVEEE